MWECCVSFTVRTHSQEVIGRCDSFTAAAKNRSCALGLSVSLYSTRSSRTQFGVSINVWRLAGTLWTLLVAFCIVIIRCTETFWSPCTYVPTYQAVHPSIGLSSRPSVRPTAYQPACLSTDLHDHPSLQCCRRVGLGTSRCPGYSVMTSIAYCDT
jgi:hypothetical protein